MRESEDQLGSNASVAEKKARKKFLEAWLPLSLVLSADSTGT